MYGIWCLDTNDWLREFQSKVDDGGIAVLAFRTKFHACARAPKHYAFDTYTEAKQAGWCEIRKLSGA
jgi:hypothetical protein